MKRLVLISAILSVLLLADGLWMQLSHYQPGDQNTFTGNPGIILSDGQVVLISAGFLIAATVVTWLFAIRRQVRSRR